MPNAAKLLLAVPVSEALRLRAPQCLAAPAVLSDVTPHITSLLSTRHEHLLPASSTREMACDVENIFNSIPQTVRPEVDACAGTLRLDHEACA